jgi:hypothetical protein
MSNLPKMAVLLVGVAIAPALAAAPKPVSPTLENVTGADAPALSVGLKRAAGAGWDLTLGVTNFQFASSATAAAAVAGEGRAMIALDRNKPTMVSGPTYHLDALPAGIHQLDVGLYTDDGKLYARDGQPVAERIFIRSGKTKPAATAPADPTTVDFALAKNKATATGGTLNAGTIRFQQGDLIRLRWTTDEAMVLHLHGYDIEGDIAAGVPTSMVFDADLAGRFPTERHGTKPVTLVYVEVYPK